MKNTNHPIISAIVAMAENRAIGKDNRLPWHLPADLKHFKALTTGHAIIMGRKTFESIGKPLPNRMNIILTRDAFFQAPECEVVTTIDQALERAASYSSDEVFIIGGAEVYQLFMPQLDRIYLTMVHQAVEGDVFFPELDVGVWQEVVRERHEADGVNLVDYSFLTFEKHGN